MTNEVWYYERDGAQHGPVSTEELRALIEKGEISRENLAWRAGDADWNETGSFEVLVPAFRTPPPPPKHTAPPQPPLVSSPPPPPRAPQADPSAAPPRSTGPRPSQGGGRLRLDQPLRVAAVAGAAFAVAAILYAIIRPPSPEPFPEQDLVETNLVGTRVPVGYDGPVGQIKIDPSPWAEVVSLESASLGELSIPGSRSTPLVLLVPPGEYTIDLENQDGSSRCEVEIAQEESRRCSKVIRTIDAATYYREMGW